MTSLVMWMDKLKQSYRKNILRPECYAYYVKGAPSLLLILHKIEETEYKDNMTFYVVLRVF